MKNISKLSRAFAVAMTTTVALGLSAHPSSQSLDAFDLNDDGSITKQEIVTAAEAQVKELQAAFLKKYDSIPTGQAAGDGVITVEESTRAAQAAAAVWLEDLLDVFDTNNDGIISAADKAGSGKRRGHGHLLEDLDADEDGTISKAELVAAGEARAKSNLARFLKKYDTIPTGAAAGDGVITVQESLAVFQDQVADRVEGLLDRYDGNDDGEISAAEITAARASQAGHSGGRPGGRR